jgi:tetratricopeptide (TPR) repeat protein
MGRMAGTVVDTEGNPIEGVTITATSPDLSTFESVKTSDRKGRFTMAHPDVSLAYVYTFEKEGFATLQLPMRLTAGDTMRQTFTLLRGDQVAGAREGEAGAADGQRVSRVVEVYNQGVEAQQLGDLETATAKYREAAKISPELAAPRTAVAAVAFLEVDWQSAAAEAEAALELDPGDIRAMQIRFDAYRHAGDEAKAKEAADALRAVGDLGEAAKRLYNEAVDAYNAGDIAGAQSKLQQVTSLDPALAPAHLALARISLQQGSPSAAAEAAARATELTPDKAQAWILLFDAARLAGDDETARRALARIAELDPDWIAGTLYEHATGLYNEGNVEQAALELERVVEVLPELARAHYFYGMALFNLGRTDEAKAALERFVELAPEDSEAAVAREMLSYMN